MGKYTFEELSKIFYERKKNPFFEVSKFELNKKLLVKCSHCQKKVFIDSVEIYPQLSNTTENYELSSENKKIICTAYCPICGNRLLLNSILDKIYATSQNPKKNNWWKWLLIILLFIAIVILIVKLNQ